MSTTLEIDPAVRTLPPASAAEARAAWLPAEIIFFLATWLVLMIAGRERLLKDPGTFWHTVVGEQMLAGGELVRSDSLTFTFYGRPWIAHQWLGECVMALGYRLGGFDTLLLFACVLLAWLFAWIAGRWLRAGHHPLAAAAVLMLVFGASAHHFHARPHLASMALLALCFGLLCDVESGRSRVIRLAWLVPLVALWSNLHGGALAGLATVTLVFAGWLAAWALGWHSPVKSRRDAGIVLAILPACVAAIFINPFGIEAPLTWLKIMRLSLPELIQEHAPPDFTHPETWFVLVLGMVYATAIWRNAGWRVTSLMPIVWFCLACDRIRHAPLFAIVAAIAMAEILPAVPSIIRRPKLPRWLAAPALVIAAAILCQAAGWRVPVLGASSARLDPQVWPVDLLPDLKQLQDEGNATAIFNSLSYGGFLALYTPGLRTFIDDRCELFGDEFLQAYASAELDQPQRIDAWQREYGFAYALVRGGSPFDSYLRDSGGWQLVRRTPAASLYELRFPTDTNPYRN